uniref:Uncharacterized protein n=1 Tax=viral metagenome TaxID=1070528 RepID=A0A6C0EFI7_9ZZZZ
MKFIKTIFFTLFALINSEPICTNNSNQCIQFTVGSGTGCAWMCNYCANQLGTNNYYFTDNVCTYQTGEGCVGNPIVGKTYTCCSST